MTMKANILTCAMLMLSMSCIGQSLDRMQYQSVIRDSAGTVLVDRSVGVRISLIRGSATGVLAYAETHQGNTGPSGVLSLMLGAGTVVSGDLSRIDWSQGPYFIRMETDPSGGANYPIVGSTQLLSVPYALFAKSAALRYSITGDTLFSGGQYVIVPGLSASNANAVAAGSPQVITTIATSVSSGSASVGGQVIGQGGSVVTARGICYGTSASPKVTDNTVASGTGTGTFHFSLSGLSPAATYYVRAYAVNASGTSYGNQVSFRTEGAAGQGCAQGSTVTITHTSGDVAPLTKTVTYRLVQTDLSGSSKCWIAQHLGADRQAISETDFTESSAGWYWQFNRRQGYAHDGVDRTPAIAWPSISENSNWTSANDPCTLLLGAGWRIPTSTEWEIVLGNAGTRYGNLFSSELRIHRAGRLLWNGTLHDRGSEGQVHSRNQSGDAHSFKVMVSMMGVESNPNAWNYRLDKTYAASVRCLKD
jgi:hypothetical protein